MGSPSKLGLIGILKEEIEQDFWGTMERLATLGFKGLEGGGKLLEGDVNANLERYHALGLEVPAIGVKKSELQEHIHDVIQRAKALQTKHIIVYWGPCESKEQLVSDAKLYNSAGKKLSAEGLKLCYHNHEHELKTTFNGVRAWDILLEYTDPEYVFFELDIAWAFYGGVNPLELLKQAGERIPIIHVKDLRSVGERGMFTTVGTGIVNIKECVRYAHEIGVEWLIVEQDRVHNLSPWDTVTASYFNLKELGLL